MCDCPYCNCQVSEVTLEMNGIVSKERITERMREMVLSLVHK
jgi:hypothetical protein